MNGQKECQEPSKEELLYEIHNKRKVPKTLCRLIWYCIKDFFIYCCYIPCPPCPKYIIPKFAFHQLSAQRTKVKGYLIHPGHTKQLACYYMKRIDCKEASFVLLRCHGNATDLGMEVQFNACLAFRLSCDVFEFDYCGYGMSTGKPSESNLYKDVLAVYNFLTLKLKVHPMRIVVFGQSIGTIPAIHLASCGVAVKGLIVEGVLMSALKFICPENRSNLRCDQFECAKKIPLIKCLTLVIHGASDDTTYYDHAEHFMQLCQTLVPPLIIPDGEHNTLCKYKSYWNRLEIFFVHELGGRYAMDLHWVCGFGCKESHSKPFPEEEKFAKHLGLSYPFEKHRRGSFGFSGGLDKCDDKTCSACSSETDNIGSP